ncbi:ferric reductase NAD binding domain-containing protein [Gautieria morchelliformis]|nr:ferric reductase NAD binding domain-containing protein [Gautieria morchelliformis]
MSSSSSVNLAAAAKPVDPNTAIRVALSSEYPKEVWYLVASVIFVASLFHILSFLWNYTRKASLIGHISSRQAGSDLSIEGARSPRPSTSVSLRRLPQAISSAFRITAFRWTVKLGGNLTANLVEITVIGGYLIALLVWEFVNTRNITTHQNLDLTYWANRAGTLAASQTPLIVALAGKNNIISLLTGISYEKLNIVHRGVARAVMLLVWIHTAARIKAGLVGDQSLSQVYIQAGILAMVAYTLLMAIGLRPVRQAAYEFFYYSHTILALIMLFGAYFHMKDVLYKMGNYVWPALLVWGIDRAIRTSWLLFSNLPFLHSNTSPSTVEILSNDALRLTVSRRHITWRPGQSMFVNLPSISTLPFESHPFTISTVAESKGEKELVFLIKARNGLTGRLRDVAREASGSTKKINVILDGPYGSPPDLSPFSTVVLMAGGSGVSYCLPLFTDIVRRTAANKAACRRVVLVWSVRVPEHMHWISKALIQTLADAPSHLQIDVRIQVTGRDMADVLPTLEKTPQGTAENSKDDLSIPSSPDGSKVDTDDKEDIDSEPELAKMRGVRIQNGRPDIHRILEEEVSCADGPVSVDVCGPHALSEAVRSALSSGIAGPMGALRGRESVTLHVEKFAMA